MKSRYNWSATASRSCVKAKNNKSVATKFIMAGFFEFSFCMFSLCFWENIMSWFVNCAGRVALAQDELFRTLQTDQPTEQVFSKWKVHGNMHIDTRTVKLLLNRNPDFSSNHFILRSRETASSIGCLFEMLKPFRFYNSTPVWMLYSA